MDTSIIDEFYNIYQTEYILDAEAYFEDRRKVMELRGDYSLIPTLKEYIKSQSNLISNYFVSNKDAKKHDYHVVQEIVNAFEVLNTAVNFYMPDYLYNDGEDHYDEYIEYYEEPKVQDIFNINFNFLDTAYERYCILDRSCYEKIKEFIDYVRTNEVLDAIYKNTSWRKVNIEELIYALYDKIEDKSIFEAIKPALADQKCLFFNNIKENCSRINTKPFDKYRPQLNSSKQLRADFEKLIFCKNLLLFYETGNMVEQDGRYDYATTELEELLLFESFNQLYSKSFDSEEFKTMQGNFVLNPEIISFDFKLEKGKRVKKGDKQILGFLISTGKFVEHNKIHLLLHMEIGDVTNSYSNYEIQLSLIPQGNINNRIQLIRLDNWEKVQPHKNIANKLSTTTHIHLYNEFDLLRGKENGNFDIAYNVNDASTDFKAALKTFLSIVEFDEKIQQDIFKLTLKSIEEHSFKVASTEI